ncbi:hypothetical protein [Biformimicrobium ophioploci]|uniref:Lipoprotein n=1 Tax=Biformimicrobium ophioploci TaxID=3036711 RepID=A0ABQ6LZP5_9GAMM|nr:hypothetical protein [Microbulbifer sp. NKW57]GMG87566.1 hypothetical protein MNKW57_18870 [Microbulbifer sp. NKW57]
MGKFKVMAIVLTAVLGISGCIEAQQDSPVKAKNDTGTERQETQERIGPRTSSGQLRTQDGSKPEVPSQTGAGWIFVSKGSRQCEGGGMTLDQSKGRLESAGVKVVASSCGVRTDMMYIQVCGGATGDILLHQVDPRDMDKALAAGYRPASAIKFEFSACRHQDARPPRTPRDQT